MSRRSYVTRQRLEQIARRLNQRQSQILEDLCRLHLASGQQLRRLHHQDTEAGRRLARMDLAQLVEWRVLARLKRRIGGVRAGSDGYVYALDVAGQRWCYPDRKRRREPWTPQPSHLRHALAVSELYMSLRLAEQAGGGELLLEFDAEPECWRHFSGPGGGRLVVKPDAYVVLGVGSFEDSYFVEVDCGTESSTRIAGKAKVYVRYWQSGREQAEDGVFPRVLWIVPDEQRRAQLADALSRLPAEHWQLFAVITAAEAAERMSRGSIGATESER